MSFRKRLWKYFILHFVDPILRVQADLGNLNRQILAMQKDYWLNRFQLKTSSFLAVVFIFTLDQNMVKPKRIKMCHPS